MQNPENDPKSLIHSELIKKLFNKGKKCTEEWLVYLDKLNLEIKQNKNNGILFFERAAFFEFIGCNIRDHLKLDKYCDKNDMKNSLDRLETISMIRQSDQNAYLDYKKTIELGEGGLQSYYHLGLCTIKYKDYVYGDQVHAYEAINAFSNAIESHTNKDENDTLFCSYERRGHIKGFFGDEDLGFSKEDGALSDFIKAISIKTSPTFDGDRFDLLELICLRLFDQILNTGNAHLIIKAITKAFEERYSAPRYEQSIKAGNYFLARGKLKLYLMDRDYVNDLKKAAFIGNKEAVDMTKNLLFFNL